MFWDPYRSLSPLQSESETGFLSLALFNLSHCIGSVTKAYNQIMEAGWEKHKAAQHKQKGKEQGKGDLCKGAHFSRYWCLCLKRDDRGLACSNAVFLGL